MNRRTTADLLSIVSLAGTEQLFLPAAPVHAALIRATTADPDGNLTMEQEPAALTAYAQAAATRASGGVVIAQVKRVAARGALNPHFVKVPGILVDYVVVDGEQIQASGIPFEAALSGEAQRALEPSLPGSEVEQRMARRAARELATAMSRCWAMESPPTSRT